MRSLTKGLMRLALEHMNQTGTTNVKVRNVKACLVCVLVTKQPPKSQRQTENQGDPRHLQPPKVLTTRDYTSQCAHPSRTGREAPGVFSNYK